MCVCVYVCVYVCMGECATAHMWKSENDLQE